MQDVAYRAIAAQQKPDHAMIARFLPVTRMSWLSCFSSVPGLCKEAGLVKVGVVAIEGTKVHANPSHHCNVDYDQLAREILSQGNPQLCVGMFHTDLRYLLMNFVGAYDVVDSAGYRQAISVEPRQSGTALLRHHAWVPTALSLWRISGNLRAMIAFRSKQGPAAGALFVRDHMGGC